MKKKRIERSEERLRRREKLVLRGFMVLKEPTVLH